MFWTPAAAPATSRCPRPGSATGSPSSTPARTRSSRWSAVRPRPAVADRVRGVQGDILGLFDVVERDGFDAVLCHGVLEYVDEPAEGVRNAVEALRPSGALSLLAAYLGGAVLARALAGHFTEARQALTDPAGRWGEGDPVPRRFTAEQLSDLVSAAGLEIAAVHGVRVFADLVPGALVDTEPGAMEALLKLEAAVAEQPAFHSVATQLHVLGEKRR